MRDVFAEGENIYLRKVEMFDIEKICEWKNDPLVKEMALDPLTEITIQNQTENIRRAMDVDWQLFLITVLKENDEAIGYIRIDWIDDDCRFAWLRFVTGSHRREGNTKDALIALLKKLFNENLHRAECETYNFNLNSRSLLERIGFINEGIKRKAHFDGEKYSDVYMYGLLKSDFKHY